MINKGSGKICLNLSPSSLNVFMQSPLLFYLTYIAKVPDDTPVPLCYSLSGNLVHSCLEKYARGELDRDGVFSFFLLQWEEQGLDSHRNLQNEVISKNDYILALIRGLNIVDMHEDHVCEEIIEFPFVENDFMRIGLKGIIDLQATQKDDKKPVLIDYKTSSSSEQNKDFERQALFYNFLIHKKTNTLPAKTIFHYLKLGLPKVYSFSHEHLNLFEEELKVIANRILDYGADISKYPAGKIADIFNSKKQACISEINRRKLLGLSNVSGPKTLI